MSLIHDSDTLKRHERLHERGSSSPSKRKATESHTNDIMGLGYPTTAQSSMLLNPKTESVEGTGNNDPFFNPDLPFPVSPAFLSHPDTSLSPLSAPEIIPMSFDFDLNALNQFLTSGNLDVLMDQIDQPFTAPPFSENLTSQTSQILRTYSTPRLSDAINAAWFTNMEEQDLETESAMLRSLTYGGDMVETLDQETGNIDEAWREKVNSNLVPQVFSIAGPLPSIEFLVR